MVQPINKIKTALGYDISVVMRLINSEQSQKDKWGQILARKTRSHSNNTIAIEKKRFLRPLFMNIGAIKFRSIEL